MKKIFLSSLVFLSSIACFAQNNDPYKVFGHDSKVVYETPVTELLYAKNSDTSSFLKALAFDIDNGYVILLGRKDTILDKLKVQPEQLLRWLSVDPLTQKFPNISPYAAFNNNPIRYTDPTGAAPDDWVKNAEGQIEWDKNAKSQATTKAGSTYLGTTLTFTFNSYIDKKTWDGPNSKAPGDKLTSTIYVTEIKIAKVN